MSLQPFPRSLALVALAYRGLPRLLHRVSWHFQFWGIGRKRPPDFLQLCGSRDVFSRRPPVFGLQPVLLDFDRLWDGHLGSGGSGLDPITKSFCELEPPAGSLDPVPF